MANKQGEGSTYPQLKPKQIWWISESERGDYEKFAAKQRQQEAEWLAKELTRGPNPAP
jgi:hypothetical protein